MEVSSAMRERRSIRSFRSEQVDRATIREILDEARWAPSWANAQDWSVTVVRGLALHELKADLKARVESHEPPQADIPMPRSWPDHIKARMMFKSMPEGSAEGMRTSSLWDIYGAPCLLLFAIDERLSPEYACFDAGLLVQNICLAATDRGLGTCVMAMSVAWPEALRKVAPADGQRFIVGVALGLPDADQAVNTIHRERVYIDEFVSWVE